MDARILVINPNSSEAVTRGIDGAVEPLRMAGGPAIECITLKEGPPGIETQQHVDGVVALVVRTVREREKDVTNEAPPVVAAAMPAPVLARGSFVSDAHETAGRVSLQRTASGTVLRLEGFTTSNGPDVRVYLVAADSIEGSATVMRAETIDLGALKGNIGDQNYVLPSVVDLARYRAVSIWCRRFSVNFGAAVLRRTGA